MRGNSRRKIARINKKLIFKVKNQSGKGREQHLVNSRYHNVRVAHKMPFDVKKGKKKPNAKHPAQLGINRHSKLNDGNK